MTGNNLLANSLGGPVKTASSNEGFGFGVTAGYKANLCKVFVVPEVFYDYLNLTVGDYYNAENGNAGNKISFRGRLGAKVNLGANITDNVAAYLTYGFARVDYVSKYPVTN